jgi:hypothetical protein
LYCNSNQIMRLENLPESLQVLYCHGNQITCIESKNLPVCLSIFSYDEHLVTHVDNVEMSSINFSIHGFQIVRRLQKRIHWRFWTRRDKAIRLIQKYCTTWLWKPTSLDGTFGINLRLLNAFVIE